MKSYSILILMVALFFSTSANAKIWRVNNNGYSADFASLQTAHDGAQPGDTLHLEPSTAEYNGISVKKKLVIIGGGYFTNVNQNTSHSGYASIVKGSEDIYFYAGSEGSQLIGLSFGGDVNIYASNICIKRCHLAGVITLDDGISNIKIFQNFFEQPYNAKGNVLNVDKDGLPTDLIFNNNICQRSLLAYFSASTVYTLLECNNNIFDYPATTPTEVLKLNTGSFRNNIITSPNALASINGGNYSNVTHNISASNLFGTFDGNIVVDDTSTLFVGADSVSPDGRYQLKEGSLAKTPGSDGSDRGPFGGAAVSHRYVLSGLAPIPVIYQLTTAGVATPTSLLPVTIKARTIK